MHISNTNFSRHRLSCSYDISTYFPLCFSSIWLAVVNSSSRKPWREGNRVKNSFAVSLFSMECSSETLLAPKMRATKALKSNVEELRTCGRKVANSTYRMPEIRHTLFCPWLTLYLCWHVTLVIVPSSQCQHCYLDASYQTLVPTTSWQCWQAMLITTWVAIQSLQTLRHSAYLSLGQPNPALPGLSE